MQNNDEFLKNEFQILSPVLEVITKFISWEYSYEKNEFKITTNRTKLFVNAQKLLPIEDFFKPLTNPSEWNKIEDFLLNLIEKKVIKNTIFKGYNDYKDQFFFISGKIIDDPLNKNLIATGIITDITDYITNEKEMKKRDNQQNYLEYLTKILLQQSPIEESDFYKEILKKLTEVLNIEGARIIKKNNDLQETLTVIAEYDCTNSLDLPKTLSTKNTAAGKAFNSTGPVLIQSLSDEEKQKDFDLLSKLGIESGIWVAIKNDRGAWGILAVLSKQRNSFSISDVSFMQSLANIIGTFQDQRISSLQQSKLYQFSELVLNEKNEKSFFSSLLKDSMSILDLQILGILQFEKKDRKYNITYVYNSIEIPNLSYLAEDESNLLKRLYNNDNPVSFLKVSPTDFTLENQLIAFNQEFNEKFSVKSGIVASIKLNKVFWGFLIGISNNYISFTKRDENFFKALSNIVGSYLEKIEKEHDLEKYLSKQRKLTELSNLSLTITDEQEFYEKICREVCLLFDFEITNIIKYDPLKDQFISTSKFENGITDQDGTNKYDESTISGFTILHQEIVIIKDLNTDKRFKHSPFIKYNIKSGIACPLKNTHGVWGVFGAFSSKEIQLTIADTDFFQNVANIIGSFLERKQIAEELIKNRSFETIAMLSSGIAHDFNNYLSIIQGYVDLLYQDSSKMDQLSALENIKNTITKSANLIKHLQTISRNEVIKYSNVNLNEIIDDMKELISQKVKSTKDKKISVIYEVSVDIYVKGDITQLSQLILNLVTNAIEAISNEGKIVVKTKILRQEDLKDNYEIGLFNSQLTGSQYAYLSVQDNGIGMEEQLVDRIFTPYLKGKKTTSTTGQNMGLGLSIVYGIVKQMNGDIKVTSHLDTGTKFEILFESTTPELLESNSTKSGKITAKKSNYTKSETDFKVLLVDDNEAFLELMNDFLKKNNYNLLTAINGKIALETYKRNKDIRLIITDVIMPEINGRDLISIIRQKNKNLPIIVISGNVNTKIDDILDEKTIFLAKPFSMDKLLSFISKLTLQTP